MLLKDYSSGCVEEQDQSMNQLGYHSRGKIDSDIDKKIKIGSDLNKRDRIKLIVLFSTCLIWSAYWESKWTTIGSTNLEMRGEGSTKDTSSEENSMKDYLRLFGTV